MRKRRKVDAAEFDALVRLGKASGRYQNAEAGTAYAADARRKWFKAYEDWCQVRGDSDRHLPILGRIRAAFTRKRPPGIGVSVSDLSFSDSVVRSDTSHAIRLGGRS